MKYMYCIIHIYNARPKSRSGHAAMCQIPQFVFWHYLNHRLELAVGDVVKEISGINNLKIVFDKLYSLQLSAQISTQIKHLWAARSIAHSGDWPRSVRALGRI